MRCISLCLAAAFLSAHPSAAQGSFATGLSNAGLNAFRDAVLPMVNKELAAFNTIPDVVEHSIKTPIGHVKLELTHIKASGLKIDHLDVDFLAPNQVRTHFEGLRNTKITMHFHWRKNHWPHVKSSGSIDITPGDVNVGATVAISTASGKAHVSAQGVHANFGSFKIKFHGGASWLYNILSHLLKGTLRKAIAKAVDGALTTAINTQANAILARLPTQMHLGGGNSSTTYQLAVAEFDVKGAGGAATAILGLSSKAHDAATGALCPIAAPAMPAIVTPAHYMLQAQLSPALLSCALWTAYQNRALNAYYTKAARGAFPLPLSTKGWSVFVPALAAKYPADLPMDARITFQARSPPTLVASPKGGLVLHNVSTVFDFGVMQGVGPAGFLRGGGLAASTPAFSMGAVFDVGFKVTTVNEHNAATGKTGPVLKFAVTALSVDFSVLRSSIGAFKLQGLQGLTDLLLPFMKSAFNYFGGMGFPLPALGGMAFSNPAVVFQNNALAINTNITFSM